MMIEELGPDSMPDNKGRASVREPNMPSSFEADYPAITRWIKEFGHIEIGYDSFMDNFVKALDRGGMPWGGRSEYETIDEALIDLERGIKAFLKEQGLVDEDSHDHPARKTRTFPSPGGKTRKPVAKRPRKAMSRADKDPHRSEDEKKAIKKFEKLEGIAEALRQGADFSTTRLTVIKGLCADAKAAGAFALFLARKIQRRMREKESPKRYRELVNRAVREMKPYLDDPTEDRAERLRSLLREIEAEQDEYEKIRWGLVRHVKSFDLLVVEHALKGVLRPYEAPFWLYHAARDYTGKTDQLIPKSAPMVEDIAGFWRKHFGIKR
jgi:hypothetical protein